MGIEDGEWAELARPMAQAYINTFRSRAGLSAEHAVQAEHTGIVSEQLGVSPQMEHRLTAVATWTALLVSMKSAQNRNRTIW